jgi:hypothetical protein
MSCSNLEEGSQEPLPEILEKETFTNEHGDLLRLEKRDGKRVAVKVQKGSGKGQGREKECFRCGRKGHIRPNCNWSTHKDGGTPRPPPPPKVKDAKGANNLEEQVDFGSLDICALEPVTAKEEDDEDDEWTTWEQDPWLLGEDPWAPGSKAGSGARSPPVPSAQSGKDLLEGVFRIRPKCAICDKAGVYQQVADQLDKMPPSFTHMLLGPSGKVPRRQSRLPWHPAIFWILVSLLLGHPARKLILQSSLLWYPGTSQYRRPPCQTNLPAKLPRRSGSLHASPTPRLKS